MARKVMEDALSFFYLSEPNLMHEEKQFREDVWRFHGATESIESVRCANVSNPDLAPAIDAELKRRKELLEKHPRLSAIEGGRRGRIRQGRENHVLHDREILERRGIQTEVYDLGRKVLSNFAHFSTLSHPPNNGNRRRMGKKLANLSSSQPLCSELRCRNNGGVS